jgi:hypothetical protein
MRRSGPDPLDTRCDDVRLQAVDLKRLFLRRHGESPLHALREARQQNVLPKVFPTRLGLVDGNDGPTASRGACCVVDLALRQGLFLGCTAASVASYCSFVPPAKKCTMPHAICVLLSDRNYCLRPTAGMLSATGCLLRQTPIRRHETMPRSSTQVHLPGPLHELLVARTTHAAPVRCSVQFGGRATRARDARDDVALAGEKPGGGGWNGRYIGRPFCPPNPEITCEGCAAWPSQTSSGASRSSPARALLPRPRNRPDDHWGPC